MTREEMLDEAVRLLRVVNTYESAEEQRAFFDKYCSDEDLKEYIDDIHAHGYLEMTEEELDELCRQEAELEMSFYEDEHYTPSATRGDYSPSCPWNAPGMSVSDFI